MVAGNNSVVMYKDISIIIPATNEILHIERSIKSALTLTDKVFVVDSHSTDGTKDVAEKLGAKVFQYDWTAESNFSKKMNWALVNLPIETTWVMRLDADEYLVNDWNVQIDSLMNSIPDNVNGVNVLRRIYFLGRWMRHRDNYPRPSMRILRYGKARFENRWLDEHIDLEGGSSMDFPLEIADNPNITISRWIDKHNRYSLREAVMLIDGEIGLMSRVAIGQTFDEKAVKTKKKKNSYNKLKPYWRGFFYFCYRYFFKLGFLDGREGFLWDFYHAWWYRNLVDTKVQEIYSICGKDPETIRKYLMDTYKMKVE